MRSEEATGTTVSGLTGLADFMGRNLGKLSVLGFLGAVPIGIAMLRDDQLAGGSGAMWPWILIVVSLMLVLGVAVWIFRRFAYDYFDKPSVSTALSATSGRILAAVLIIIVANVFVYSLVPDLSGRWMGLANQLIPGSFFLAGWIYLEIVSESR